MTTEAPEYPLLYNEEVSFDRIQERTIKVKFETTSFCHGEHDLSCMISPRLAEVMMRHQEMIQSIQVHLSTATIESRLANHPTGLHIVVDINESHVGERNEEHHDAALKSLISILQSERFVIAPLESYFAEPRLHRHIYHASGSSRYEIILPQTIGTSETVGVEGWVSFLGLASTSSSCGLWSMLTPLEWSSWWLEGMTTSKFTILSKRLWWTLSSKEVGEDRIMSIDQGLEFTTTFGDNSVVSVDRLLSSTKQLQYRPCPCAPSSRPRLLSDDQELFDDEAQHSVWMRRSLSDLVATARSPSTCKQSDSFALTKSLFPGGGAGGGTYRLSVTKAEASNKECFTDEEESVGRVSGDLFDIMPMYLRPKWSKAMSRASKGNEAQPPPSLHKRGDGSLDVVWKNISVPFEFTVEFDSLLLPFELFPADPNRGMEVPVAILQTPGHSPHGQDGNYHYSNSLLWLPPVPDMSMPFNIISLTCTLYAFIVGSLLNWMVRRSSQRIHEALDPTKKSKSKLALVKERILSKFSRKKTLERSDKEKQE